MGTRELRRTVNRNEDAAKVRKTPEAQLKALDWRLGKGVGATRERARLATKVTKGAA